MSVPGPVSVMLDQVGPVATAELERALRLTLTPPAAPAERALTLLLPLARMLNADPSPAPVGDGWPGVPVVATEVYEQTRREGDPSARHLRQVFGSWMGACRAAYGLHADGSTTGPGRPWTTRRAVRERGFRWDDEQCRDWLRRCACDLGRVPTVGDYNAWRHARYVLPSSTLRVPTSRSVIEHAGHEPRPSATARRWGMESSGDVPGCVDGRVNPSRWTHGSWKVAVMRAAIDPQMLADVRASRLPRTRDAAPLTVAQRLDALDHADLDALALTATQAKHLRKRGQRLRLPLAAAIELARTLDCSLAHLAGAVTNPGDAPTRELRLDLDAVDELRRHRNVSTARLRDAAGLSLSQWRQIRTRRLEPTLGTVVSIAAALEADVGRLLALAGE